MSKFELKLPKMGESVAEATLTTWLKEVGDAIELDEAVVEIATDKVDSEVPSEVEGILIEKCFDVDEVVQVGQTIAVIETNASGNNADVAKQVEPVKVPQEVHVPKEAKVLEMEMNLTQDTVLGSETKNIITESNNDKSTRFYSPLVKNIAAAENISTATLETIQGTGKDGRVTKNDILQYVESQKGIKHTPPSNGVPLKNIVQQESITKTGDQTFQVSGEDEIIEMTRMGKLIAHHMKDSIQTAAHVQSFIEVDVTAIWNWRNKVKDDFYRKEGERLTFTPIFMESIAKALRDFPMLNISVSGDSIIKKKSD